MQESDGEADPLFDTTAVAGDDEIFRNRELVDTNHIPNKDRIVGRSEQIQQVAAEVGPLIAGSPANSILIFGKTGTGKSLVAKHVMDRLQAEGHRQGTAIGTAYVNCSQTSGGSRVIRNIGRDLSGPECAVSFPSRGISTDEYYERLWQLMNQQFDAVVIAIDEVDMLKEDTPLMVLSRAGETGSVDVPISVIAISNKIDYRNQMNQRTKSSFGHREFVFDPYDATQLREILEHRRDAFHPGVLEDGVIPRVAALAAKEHGDARKGVEVLKYLGQYAVQHGKSHIAEEDIEEVREIAEAERLRDLLSGLPQHTKYVVIAIAYLTRKNSNQDWFRTTQVIDSYRQFCEREGYETLSSDRIRELLDEVAFLKITEKETQHSGRGKGKGTYNRHRLLWDPEVVEHIHDSDQGAGTLL
jgi:cell division control protein 6